MRHRSQWLAGGWAAAGLAGCSAIPPLENPVLVRPHNPDVENPMLVSPGTPTPEGYMYVYERVLDALDDYFDIIPSDRYAGQIDTRPKVAVGYEQAFKAGSPEPRERLLATLQSIRHRAVVRIAPGERGGYRIYVEVYKELEDVPRPSAARNGPASFREAPTQDRRIAAVGAATADGRWIPIGRDPAFEQVLLRKIQVLVCR